jgi:hypothetical protein
MRSHIPSKSKWHNPLKFEKIKGKGKPGSREITM